MADRADDEVLRVRATFEAGGLSSGGGSMLGVKINITRYVDFSFPGWVECTLVDVHGQQHVFVEKVPAVSKVHLEADMLPLVTVLACSVVSNGENDAGCQIVRIDTQTPWGIESTAGRTQFDVLQEQLCELPR